MNRKPFSPRRYARNLDLRLFLGFALLLYTVGGGLIWLFYGLPAMLLGAVCITGGLGMIGLLYGLVSLVGRWAGE
ncbi:MAG: hypothetical protein KBG20_21460 [Caldilineaceae bacterium]|nr:hypothetical protein [Caldilineaceae bacterium]MBP8109835.1 hypothetical protein [Caldilineaceae bacterium]MBP8125293.1 hypothetical protein [Caldilineaceae bacterium]MBP9074889.1 hypothetical protein [Caldilineaceae bacterium]